MIIHDVITADQVEDTNQVMIDGDPLENVKRTDVGDLVVIRGYSHNTGDIATYNLHPDYPVELWAV